MKLFVTVGSTRFDALVALFEDPGFLRDLEAAGASQVTIQRGASPLELGKADTRIRIDSFEYVPSTLSYISQADLVISHAAAGTRLDVLSCGKPHLLVANETLMRNHQQEYVEALRESSSCLAFPSIQAFRAFVAEPGRLQAEVSRMSEQLSKREESSEFGAFLNEAYAKWRESRAWEPLAVSVALLGLMGFCAVRALLEWRSPR